ncbi:hypothetical protein [Pseudorhizobium endolithicum]|uniref:hypothetical protein n=1 Tax=Pseudorhizobium endolithicum TaxID=1191678 RepID=UPI00115BFB2F|nr:hypothetical protein [Pseudorhizobium endolithicum]
MSRIPRKLLLVLAGVTVLGGGSGAAAVYIGAERLLGPSYSSINGLACTVVETVRIRRADRYWIRKYVTTDKPGDGISRLRTALRVARKVQETEHSDLVQVTVLDPAGPSERSAMRGRAIGAQVVYIPDMSSIPHPARVEPISAYYVDGPASATGEFWGLRIDLPLEDAEALLAALTDDADCLEPVVEGAGDGHGKAAGHGEAKDHGASKGGHDEEPETGPHGAPSGEHGDGTPVAGHEADGEPGLLASLTAMVGLGGEAAETAHEAGDAAGHDLPPDHHVEPKQDASSGSQETEQDRASADPSGEAARQAPAEDKGWLDSIKGMVGLDTGVAGTEPRAEPAADAGDAPVKAEEPQAPNVATEKSETDGVSPKPVGDHGSDWLAKMRAQPLTPETASEPAADEVPQGVSTAAAKPQGAMVAKDDDPEKHRRSRSPSKPIEVRRPKI